MCRKSILEDNGDIIPPTENVSISVMDILENKADKSTTLAEYGITDAYTKDEIDSLVGDVSSMLSIIHGDAQETIKLQSSYIGGGVE